MPLNLNINPYNDDFDPRKNFYKVLFRPGKSVQSRELTTLQSILQNQIESFGRYQFKQGQRVIPGEVGLNTRLDYIKLSSVSEEATTTDGNIVFKKFDIKRLIGTTVSGLTSGVTATVIAAEYGSSTEADTLFVKYIGSGNQFNEKTFRQGETLESSITNTPQLVVGTDGSVLPTDTPAMGFGSAVKIEEGIYFVNGLFVRNDEDLVIVSKYDSTPTAKVGFVIIESIVTPEEDSSLFDNARGFSNYSAPGATRLKVELKLTVYKNSESTSTNFIELLSLIKGEIQSQVVATDYSLIEEVLAKRTFDESGDYVVENFPVDVREYAQLTDSKGYYIADINQKYGGLSAEQAKAKMIVSIGPGKAYIKGYETVNKETKYITIDKARSFLSKNDNKLKLSGLSSYYVTNAFGSVSLNSEGQYLSAYPQLYMYSVFGDGSLGYSNTETATAYKQTLNRRTVSQDKIFNTSTGIQTIYIELAGGNLIPTNATFGSTFNTLYFVTTKGLTPATTIVSSVDVLSFSSVTRSDISPGITYLELTVYGKKIELNAFFKEYDLEDLPNRRRKLFLTENDARNNTAPYGIIVDYNNIITPLIGVAKAKDFGLVKDAQGFNPDTDKSISKGSLSDGTAIYNGIFKVSHFNPEFFTKILTTTPVTTGFTTGKYINGNDSGAYGVVEGAPTSGFSTGNVLFVKTLFGKFIPGETVVDESGNSLKIAEENTISHFVVLNRGEGYSVDSTLVIDGQSFNSSAIELKNSAGNLYACNIKNRDLVNNKYLIPPVITVNSNPGQVTAVTINAGSGGTGYNNAPLVVFTGGGGVGASANATVSGGVIQTIIVTNTGSGYTTPPTVSFTPQGGDTPSVTAVATATISSLQSVTQICKIAPVMFRNTVLDYNNSNVKSFASFFGAAGAYRFTGDVEVSDKKYSTQKSITDFTFSGSVSKNYLECDAFGGDPTPDLVQGDIIQYSDSSGVTVRSVVQYATSPSGLSKGRIYIDNYNKVGIITSKVIAIKPKLENSQSSTLVVPTGAKYLKSLVTDSQNSGISYYFRRDFVSVSSPSSGNVTFVAQLPYGTQRFAPFKKEDFLITVLQKNSATTVATGDILYVTSDQVIITNSIDTTNNLTSGTITVSIPKEFFGWTAAATTFTFPVLKLTCTVEVSKALPRLKTSIKNKRITINSSGDRVIPFRGKNYDANSPEILSYSDAYKFHYVYEGSTTTPPVVDSVGKLISGNDVTERFTFDDGQRDTFYDISRLVLKPGYDAPVGQLVVAFDYFEHSQGDFCTVDSYSHESGVSLEDIPSFNSAVFGKIKLRDSIDFRPKVDSVSFISGFQDSTILSVENANSFSGVGGVTSSSPAADASLEYTIKYNSSQYLDRIDSIFINKNGEFSIKQGNPSLNPSKPEVASDGFSLYYLYIPAYTDSANDVKIIPVDNRRYTMRDIGKLEKRVERLEQYTSLSVLEQQALNTQIKGVSGIDLFKTGFIVDNFENHSVGNLSSVDYKCAVDTQQSVLRPPSAESSLALKEVYTRDDQRFLANYKRSGDIITLPYQNVSSIKNIYATKKINPNPFVVLQYAGDCAISPLGDHWFDDAERPIILNNDSQIFSIFYSKNSAREGFASIYNSYAVNWSGTNRSFFNVTSLASLDSVTTTASVQSATLSSSSNVSPQNNEIAKGIFTSTIGNTVVNTTIQTFARSIPISFVLRRLKPNTVINVFIDGKKVNAWVVPDSKFTGIGGNSSSSFGQTLVSDENGNASGILLFPAGYAPQNNSVWTGDVKTTLFDTLSEKRHFITGIKTIRFTSSADDARGLTTDSFTETKYYASGILPQQPASIVATAPAIFKADEGIQLVESSKKAPNPLSQSFKIENFDGGVFLTGLDLFFASKSNTIPVRVYLTNIVSGKPGKYIVPGSISTLESNTKLRVFTNANVEVSIGEKFVGSESGASGPLLEIIDKNGNKLIPSTTGKVTLVNDQVYIAVLSNNNGKVFKPNEVLNISSVTSFNISNNQNLKVTIAKDSGRITGLKITSAGQNYSNAFVTIESPQLIGGITSTANVKISDGKVYYAEVSIPGSGYTDPPSVIIKGAGNGNSGAEIQALLTIDTPAVRMGVAIDPLDDINVLPSTTPTRFNFDYPVYLQNNTEYAFVIETDSIEYKIWGSRLGDVDTVTNAVVTTQPLLGSVFKSQNSDTWTEDLFEDIKFTLYRAEFSNVVGELLLTNEDLGYELLESNPLETDADSNIDATSKLWRNNNKLIKVNHHNNGFEDYIGSYVDFKNAETTGGILGKTISSTLYKVVNNGLSFYTILGSDQASSNAVGGGSKILASYNRKYEKLYPQISYLSLSSTKIETSIKTTNIRPIDTSVTTFTSYSSTDYETTFLNEEQFFTNQKVIASRINEVLNGVTRSLTYKLKLSTTKSYLSPVVDLRFASVKLISNGVEKSFGSEDRFGRRDQILSFYPVYKFLKIGGSGAITLGQTITGNNSQAVGVLVKYDTASSELFVKMKTNTLFIPNEFLTFSTQTALNGNIVRVGPAGVTEIPFDFPKGSTIIAFDPANTTYKYSDIIYGKVLLWDSKKKQLKVTVNKTPINNNYYASFLDPEAIVAYARSPFNTSGVTPQVKDIFRRGDLLFYQGIQTGTEKFVEIKSIAYTPGVAFVSDKNSKNSSSVAKYVTKEISLKYPSSTLDVRLLSNLLSVDDLVVLYKIKSSNSQVKFDDLEWQFFNDNGYADEFIAPSTDTAISGYYEKQDSYKQYKYSATNLAEFTSYAIKIVMKSDNPAYAPKIQDMISIAAY